MLYLAITALLLFCLNAGAAQEAPFTIKESTHTLAAYSGTDARVVIPDTIGGVPVERLGRNLFYDNASITEAVLPAGVHTIEQSSFNSCPQLADIALPDGLKAIGSFNLFKCNSLRSVTVPASVAVIGATSFSWCDNLREIRFEGPAPALGGNNCFSVLPEDLVIYVPDDQVDAYRAILPKNIRSSIQPSGKKAVQVDHTLPDDQFEVSPDGVLTAYLGSSPYALIPPSVHGVRVTAIGSTAFESPSRGSFETVFRVDIPEGVTAIEDEAFRRCVNLDWVTLPSTLKTVGSNAFYWFMGRMSPLPDGLESVGSHAFDHVDLDNTLHIPKSLTRIGENAFYSANNLYSIYFPSGMLSIADGAFADTAVDYIAFEDADLPSIAPTAFTGKNLLDVDIAWNATRAQLDAAKGVFAAIAPGCTVWRCNPADAGVAQYPENTKEVTTIRNGVWTAYHGNAPDLTMWTSYDKIKVTGIGEGLFKGNQSIRSFYPHHADWFTIIGKEAFMNSSVEYVELFDSITHIGDRAFSGCAKMTELTLPKSLTHVGEGAFEGLTGLKRLIVQCDPSLLPKDAFKDMTALESVEIDFGTVPARMFEGLPVQTAVFGEMVTAVGEAAFAGTKLAEIRFNGQTDIAARAFQGIPAAHIVLPFAGSIDPAAFQDVDTAVMRIHDRAEDAYIAALGEQLQFPWYAGLLRESEQSGFVAMPYTPTAARHFEFDAQTGAITAYTGKAVDVVIPKEIDGVPVRTIAYSAFESCRDYTDTGTITNRTEWTRLRSVVIPETVTVIEDSVFGNCQQLELFVCYAPLETTGRNVFSNCRALQHVVFVNGVRTIDNYCFDAAGSLKTLYVGSHVDVIGTAAFNNSKIGMLVLDAKTVANGAVSNCAELTALHITGRVASVEPGAVTNAPMLSEICIETDALGFIPNDGMVSAPSANVTVTVPESSSEDIVKAAQRVISWSQPMPQVTVVKGSCDRPASTLPDIDTLLAGLSPVEAPAEEPAATPLPAALPVDQQAIARYAGVWNAVSITESGTTVTPDQMGISIALTLREDGTASILSGEDANQGSWSPIADGILISASEENVVLTIKEDGKLTMDDGSLSIVFERTGAESAPQPAAPAAEAPAGPKSETSPLSARLGRTFVCKTVEVSGLTMGADKLGAPYTVTFREDGKADFVLAGTPIPPLDWAQETAETKDGPKAALTITYLDGTKLAFVLTDAGFDLDFFGSMLMHFVPKE